MDTATIAMTLMVLREGSMRAAARRLDRPVSSVADAFERFEAAVAMRLAVRSDGALSLTLAGETLRKSTDSLVRLLCAFHRIAEDATAPTVENSLLWAAHNSLSVAALSQFNSVVRAGSVRRAARTLGLGQPNLSRQMTRLEKVLGCLLLIRTTNGCEPTPAGLQFDEAAQAFSAEVAVLLAPAGRRFAQDIRTIKLGTIIPIGHESRLSHRLAQLVASWQSSDLRPGLLVSSTTAEDVMDGIKAGRFDVALMDTPMHDKRFASMEIFASELVLVAPVAAVTAGATAQSLITGHPMAVPSLRSGLRRQITDALAPLLTVHPEVIPALVEVDTLSIIINLVVDFGYLSVLPRDAVASLRREIGILDLPGKPQVTYHLVWRRTQASRRLALQIAESLQLAM